MKIHSINCRGRLVDFSTPKIMGILNLTPDSFSDGGKFNTETSALIQTEKMLKEGALFIDLGAQSTRPNAQLISAQEEIKRIGNLISLIKKEFPEALISLDTFYSEVMRFGYEEGIDLINDISGGQFDPKVWETVAQLKLPYVLMHINPEYQTMHEKIAYDDITKSINFYFSEKINQLKSLGVHDVILDPGFGFGKTIEDQMTMIDEVEHIGFRRHPILIGISRKSFIYKPLGKSPMEIDKETQQLHLKVLQQGASILRVHDVASAKRTLDQYLS